MWRATMIMWVVSVLTLTACGGDTGPGEEPIGGFDNSASVAPSTVGADTTITSTTEPAQGTDSGEGGSTPLVALPVGRLVFDSDRADDLDLYLLEIGSTEPVRLTTEEGSDRVGRLTPDGTAVLFATDRGRGPDSPTGLRSYDLYRLELDTGEQTHLLGSRTYNSSPTLSPDGSTLAFNSDASGASHIYLAGPDASSPQQVTDENAANSGPDWSPDGTQIIYSTYVDDNRDIWIMNADGSDRRPLIEGPANELSGAWSPDGAQIAFHSDREGSRDIFLFDVASGEITQLTSGPADDGYPTWSPDGRYIAFDSDRDGDEPDIYMLTLEDGSVARLTDDPARDAFPDWGE